MSGFYPGALCIAIRSKSPENLGKMVQLISSHKANTKMIDTDGFEHEATRDVWWVDAMGGKILHTDGDWTPQCFNTERALMPLSGDPSTVEQEQELTV